MKHFLTLCSVVFLGLSGMAFSQETPAPEKTRTANHIPGLALSEGISQITGTAVSPLLGMSAVGAWKYYQTPEAQRHTLPWYCNPWVWGTCGVVLALCFMKDLFGAAAPPLVKKPLDFAELFEDKLSALVASGAFVPLIASTMAQLSQVPPESAAVLSSDMGLATAPVLAFTDSYWVKLAILLPFCLVAFFVVWLACHAINVIIAISPFGIVDAGLKLIKAGLLILITTAAFISPLLGLLVCLPLIIFAFCISGWTFRLMVFGNIFGLDVLFRRKATPEEVAVGVRAFNMRPMMKTPVRSFGTLTKDASGQLIFRQRPWLLMPAKTVVLSPRPDGLAHGLLYPSVTLKGSEGKARTHFVLLPRYRDSVPHLCTKLEIQTVTESSLKRGVTAMRQWLADMLNAGRNVLQPKTLAPQPAVITAASSEQRGG